MELKVEKVRRSKRKKQIKEIYFSSFPKKERMPFVMMIMMSYLYNTEFLSFYDGDTLTGFAYLANMGRTTFVMFLAVDEKLRSKGYGSAILDKIAERKPKNKVIISIEPVDKNHPDYEIRKRRKEFYLRNRFNETGYMTRLAGINQELIIRNGTFSKPKFITFFICYSFLAVIPRVWRKND